MYISVRVVLFLVSASALRRQLHVREFFADV